MLAAALAAHAHQAFIERFTIARSAKALLDFYADVRVTAPRALGIVPVPVRSDPTLTSVVMCVRNEATDLPGQLLALSTQTHRGPWELLVCDNGSLDGTAEVANAWRDRIPHMRVLDASTANGLNAARAISASPTPPVTSSRSVTATMS